MQMYGTRTTEHRTIRDPINLANVDGTGSGDVNDVPSTPIHWCPRCGVHSSGGRCPQGHGSKGASR